MKRKDSACSGLFADRRLLIIKLLLRASVFGSALRAATSYRKTNKQKTSIWSFQMKFTTPLWPLTDPDPCWRPRPFTARSSQPPFLRLPDVFPVSFPPRPASWESRVCVVFFRALVPVLLPCPLPEVLVTSLLDELLFQD